MKRFLSWVVLYLAYTISFIASTMLMGMTAFFTQPLTNKALTPPVNMSSFVFPVLLGLAGAGIVIAIVVLASMGAVKLSQKISPSRKGARYIVCGVLTILFSIYDIYSSAQVMLLSEYPLALLFAAILTLIFGITVIADGKRKIK